MHKWFARRPGTVFRSLLLAEFNGSEPLDFSYWRSHEMTGVIADPFMGGGTPVYEAIRLGFSVVATDINPMAYWVVRQSVSDIDLVRLRAIADDVVRDVEEEMARFYATKCPRCENQAEVKYFLWVKQQQCPACGTANDLFPGYLIAEPVRHPRFVVACAVCGEINECDEKPTRTDPARCTSCSASVHIEGPASRQRIACSRCTRVFRYPPERPDAPLVHRMWAIEYHCRTCKPDHVGRFYKRPDKDDLSLVDNAHADLLRVENHLPIPDASIPRGDETDRLHRWGYRKYREMFNSRQLLGLGRLFSRITKVEDEPSRHALLTVFSDFLRYQNLLCRYDTYSLKCQDIFSVHGFPVGLIQCENNLLGIPQVGSGAFRHFIEKFLRAKRYCEKPFETRTNGRTKTIVPITGERIQAELVKEFPSGRREALIAAAPATSIGLAPNSIDGVFTDPPYYDNVQYAELMDFCFVWLRLGLAGEFAEFRPLTTRASDELTGNATLGRGILHFTAGLSSVFRHYAQAMKPDAPFVFTFHHNDPAAYVPLVVAILDAGMACTIIHPVAAEMSASLHIAGTNSSVLDSVFVCRRAVRVPPADEIEVSLVRDADAMRQAGIRVSEGDIACLMAGHIARVAINTMSETWDIGLPLGERVEMARRTISAISGNASADSLPSRVARLREPREETG